MITVRPLIHTENEAQYVRLLTALGGVPLVQEPGWVVVGLAGGRIALHPPTEDHPVGRVDLCFESDSIDSWADAREVPVDDHPYGRTVEFRADDGVTVAVHLPTTGNAEATGHTSVLPVWMSDDVAGARSMLEAIGLTGRTDTGSWAVLAADDGVAAVHGSPTGAAARIDLAFEHQGDVAHLIPALEAAGCNPRLVEEAFGRILRVDDPDGGEALWIHEAQTHLPA